MNVRDVIYCCCEHPDGIKIAGWNYTKDGRKSYPRLAGRIIRLLIDNHFGLHCEELVRLCYEHRIDGGPLNAQANVRESIMRLRKALRPGFSIITTPNRPARYVLAFDLSHPFAERRLLDELSRRLAAEPEKINSQNYTNGCDYVSGRN